MATNNYPLKFYVDMLKDKRPFSISRFGDGEWHCIFGAKGANCNGDTYEPLLADKLRRAVSEFPEDNYFRGHLKISHHAGRERVAEYQSALPDNWVNGDVFLDAFLACELRTLVEAFPKRMLYVGPEYLAPLFGSKLLPIAERNSYQAFNSIVWQIREIIEQGNVEMIGFSAGMCANALIHHLYPMYGDSITMMDFGSLWDGCLGVTSRSYTRTLVPGKMRLATFGSTGVL